MSEKYSFILCLRKEDTKWATVTEGSTLTNCTECDEQVWISPASVQVMLEFDAKPLCLYCAASKPGRGIHPPSTEQLKEIIKELKKELKIEDPTDRLPEQGSR